MSLELRADDGASRLLAHPRIRAAITFDVGAGTFHTGLVNAHDHLHRNHYPRLGTPPYADAYEWGSDIHDRCAADIARAKALDRADALLFGALKNIIAGVTVVVHHDAREPSFDENFPVRVPRLEALHSPGFEPDLDRAIEGRFCLHLAEGTNERSAAEVQEMAARGLVRPELLAVHLVGIDEADATRLRNAGAAAVWCPTSNLFLFSRTAPPALFASGVDVLLGTDALLTGAGTLLHELAAARELALLSDERLLAAVTDLARARLGTPAADNDIVLFRKPVLEASPADVALVIVDGEPILADAALGELFDLCGVPSQPLTVGGVRKRVRAPLAAVAARAIAINPACRRIFA